MQLYGIDLNLLVAFEALMAERNVTRAGVRIGRTQPAMSAALSRLRALLRDELFVRSPDGLQPTPRAVDLAEPLTVALNQIQTALAFTQDFDAHASNAVINLGLSEHPGAVLLSGLLSALRAEAPSIVLRLHHIDGTSDALEMLESGQIDVAVCEPLADHPRILSRPLFVERLVCIARNDHPMANQQVSIERYASLCHLLVAGQQRSYANIDFELRTLGLKRQTTVTLPSMYLAPSIVARTDFVAIVMAGILDGAVHAAELCVLNQTTHLEPVSFVASWHRRNEMHPAQRWFRDKIVAVATSRGSLL